MKTSKTIIFTTEKNISSADKGKLNKNGFLVIEVKDLSGLKYPSEIQNDILLASSMRAVAENGQTAAQARFFREVYRTMYPNNPKIDRPII